MKTNLKYSVGLDVSKDDFHACISVINTQQDVSVKSTSSFDNKDKGFKQLIKWVTKHRKESIPVCFTMEATGVYYEQLAWFLKMEKQTVSVVLPTKAKRYQQSIGNKSKTDKIDSKGLAQMGAEQNLVQWEPGSNNIYTLRTLTRQCEKLNELRTEIKNQIHALEHGRMLVKDVYRQHKKLLRLIEKQITEMEQVIENLINKDSLLKSKAEKICRIKGIGTLTFATIVAETNGFVLFKNQRQLASYAGYDVVQNQSGKHVGKTRISKKGNSHIRRILHMAALNAVRHKEPQFESLYERIYDRTKIKMKGYVAVQRRLLILIYTLWKKDQAYDPKYYNSVLRDKEQKSNNQFSFEKAINKVVPINAGTTQDELPYQNSTEALF